jgi:hypothetical protein
VSGSPIRIDGQLSPVHTPVLLTLRLVALYKRKRWLSWFLYSFLTFSYGTSAVLTVVTLREYGGKSSLSLVSVVSYAMSSGCQLFDYLTRVCITDTLAANARYLYRSVGL